MSLLNLQSLTHQDLCQYSDFTNTDTLSAMSVYQIYQYTVATNADSLNLVSRILAERNTKRVEQHHQSLNICQML